MAALRPYTIVYVGISDFKLRPVRDYLKAVTQQFGAYAKLFKRSNKDAFFQFIDPTTKKVFSQVIFTTDQMSGGGLGEHPDIVFFDEAVKISYETFEGIYDYIKNDDCPMIATSTLYWQTPSCWFNDLLIEYEKESSLNFDIDNIILNHWDTQTPFEHNAGLRYTIEDSELQTPERKEQILSDPAVKNNIVKLATEYFSRSPTMDTVFSFEKNILDTPKQGILNTSTNQFEQTNETSWILTEKWDQLVASYDPARTNDDAALNLLGYSAKRNIIVQFDERVLNTKDKSSYIPQAEQMVQLLTQLSQRAQKMVFVMDTTSHDGVADLLETHGIRVWKRFKRTS